MTQTSSASNTVEYSCWILSAIIAIILIYVICSEFGKHKPPESAPSLHGVTSSKKATSSRKVETKRQPGMAKLDDAFNTYKVPEKKQEVANPALETTYTNVFQNKSSDADIQFMKAKPSTESAISGANMKSISKGLTEIGRGADAPSRIVGLTANSWKAMMDCNRKPVKVGNVMVPFMDSSFRAELVDTDAACPSGCTTK